MEQEFEKQFENPDSQFRGAPFGRGTVSWTRR